jgi:hypothetical protein
VADEGRDLSLEVDDIPDAVHGAVPPGVTVEEGKHHGGDDALTILRWMIFVNA